MKKHLLYTIFLPLFAAFTACSEGMDSDNAPYADGMGGLRLANSASTNITIPVITKSADFSKINANEFNVQILDDKGSVVKEFETFSEMVEAGFPLILPQGNYRAIASSYKLGDTKVSETPYFADEQSFPIEEKSTSDVHLKCTYQSLGVELALSNQFKALIEQSPNDYSYKVTVSNGQADWEFTPEKMTTGYFTAPCDELIVKVTVRLGSSNDWYPERTYRVVNDKNHPNTPPQLGEYYIIRLDAGAEEEKYSLKSIALTEKE